MSDYGNDPGLQLFSPGVADDPRQVYEEIRGCPVTRSTNPDLGHSVILSRYEDVWWALRHPEVFTSENTMILGEQPLIPLQVDPPRHTKYRRILNPVFVPREIEKLEPEVRAIVRGLLDEVAPRGECDFHEDFATPLPSGIFLALMGLPRSDLPMFLRWRDESIRPDVAPGDFEGAARIRARAAHEISEYFRAAIAARRAQPDDGLFSHIIGETIDGEALTETELLGIAHLLLLGGLDTVTATLDCMIVYLANHPDHRQRIIDDPDVIPSAVEELLRSESPVMMVPRAVREDVEFGGTQLRKGDHVVVLVGAANADASEFGDGAVDFDRDPNRHVAFGGGHHLCLGAHLARLELRVALEEIHARIPDYRIADGADIHFSPGIRQANHLPIAFTPA